MQKKSKICTIFDIRRFPQDLGRLVCFPLLILFRMKRLTPEGKKYKGKIRGGAILAANHTSFSDPFVLGVTVWYRRLFFLAAEVVMKGKLRKWLLKGVGAIEIDRHNTDIEAVRKSVAVLKRGHLLSVFPQGGIAGGDEIGQLKSGVILFAMQAGVPIIPMHIVPRKRWYERRVVVIGEAFDPKSCFEKKFPSTADIDRAAQRLAEEMNRCVVHQ